MLPYCTSYPDLADLLGDFDITLQYKYRSGSEESPGNIYGISFCKDGIAFRGSQIDRKFSHANLQKTFEKNRKTQELTRQKFESELANFDISKLLPDVPKPRGRPAQPQTAEPPKPVETQPQNHQKPEPPKPTRRNTQIRGIELTAEQDKTLRDGGYIYLENMNKNDSGGKFSAYVFPDDENKKVFFSNENPDKMVECGGITIRLRDKILVERGYITKAKMKWWGGIDYQYPFVWKDSKDNKVKYSFADPRIPKEVHEKELEEFRRQIRQSIPPAKKKNGPKLR